MITPPGITITLETIYSDVFKSSNVYYYMERSFAEVSKSLATYRSENNFVLTIKIIM